MDSRIGHVQRSEVLDLLSRALGEGYLSLDEYEQRLTAANSARFAAELVRQVADLPQQYRWDPAASQQASMHAQQAAETKARTFATSALIFGIVALPLSVCVIGGALGVVAILLSRPRSQSTSARTPAIIGRVLGITSIALSAGFLLVIIFGHTVGP
jgi:hypothetical protein